MCMCGRYFFHLEECTAFMKLKKKIEEQALFEYAKEEVFPSNAALVLIPDDKDTYKLDVMHWGITGMKGTLIINARSEHITEKRTFQPMVENRCLVPCNGFYEWEKQGMKKNKVAICKRQTPLFYLAGIYNNKKEFVIVTGTSKGEMHTLHTRTPIIISEHQIALYFAKKHGFTVDNEDLMFVRQDPKAMQVQLDLFANQEDET